LGPNVPAKFRNPTSRREARDHFRNTRDENASERLTLEVAAWQHSIVTTQYVKNFMTRKPIQKPTALRRGAVASCFWQAVHGLDAMPSKGSGSAMN
jgi:hypothetical protein